MLKSDFFVKNKKNNQTFSKKEYNAFMLFLNMYTGLSYFIGTTYIDWIRKVWVHLINEKAARDSWFVYLPITGVMSATRKLQLLGSDSITWLMLLCSSTYPFVLWIYCGSITR